MSQIKITPWITILWGFMNVRGDDVPFLLLDFTCQPSSTSIPWTWTLTPTIEDYKVIYPLEVPISPKSESHTGCELSIVAFLKVPCATLTPELPPKLWDAWSTSIWVYVSDPLPTFPELTNVPSLPHGGVEATTPIPWEANGEGFRGQSWKQSSLAFLEASHLTSLSS